MLNQGLDYKVDLFINNKDVPTQNYFEVRDPGKLTDVVGRVASGTVEDINNAVEAAHQAFLSWRNVDVKERVRLVLEAAKVLEDSMPELQPLLVREHGGMLWETDVDFHAGIGSLKFFSAAVEEYLKPEVTEDETQWISIEKVPKGVVAAIVPWNMPIVLTMGKVAPALLTGNTIVVKPSPNAPLALSIALKRMAAVFPDGVINVVHGDAETGNALTGHPLVRKVSFTGGTETGRAVLTNASKTFKSVTLELGGNDPAVVLDDVNPADIIPKLIKGIYTRTGQICFAVKRIYVPNSMVEKFFDTMCEFVDELKVGHGLDERASFGPINNKKQFGIVNNLLEETKKSGATVRELGTKLDPGNWNNGYYMLPHVVKDAPHSSSIVACEQFGPIIPIVGYDTVDQAIELANDTQYGLCSSIWTNDFERAKDLARKIEAGATFINTHSFESLHAGMPFGGVKNSGLGRESAIEPTLSAYVDLHAIRGIK
jgi:acyl-CoA reductase-like NAD-dependent aldehyde dehydrogenase